MGEVIEGAGQARSTRGPAMPLETAKAGVDAIIKYGERVGRAYYELVAPPQQTGKPAKHGIEDSTQSAERAQVWFAESVAQALETGSHAERVGAVRALVDLAKRTPSPDQPRRGSKI